MLTNIRRLTTSVISHLKDVDIDSEGVFKYLLVKVTVPKTDGSLEDKVIVRGYSDCPHHNDIDEKVLTELASLKATQVITDWRSNVIGGGKIEHDPLSKKLKIYGESDGYGRADHALASDILRKAFTNYTISAEVPNKREDEEDDDD